MKLDFHVNWQLSKQETHFSVSHNHIAVSDSVWGCLLESRKMALQENIQVNLDQLMHAAYSFAIWKTKQNARVALRKGTILLANKSVPCRSASLRFCLVYLHSTVTSGTCTSERKKFWVAFYALCGSLLKVTVHLQGVIFTKKKKNYVKLTISNSSSIRKNKNKKIKPMKCTQVIQSNVFFSKQFLRPLGVIS